MTIAPGMGNMTQQVVMQGQTTAQVKISLEEARRKEKGDDVDDNDAQTSQSLAADRCIPWKVELGKPEDAKSERAC